MNTHKTREEEFVENKAKEIYQSLKYEIDPLSNEINLERLKGTMSIFGNKIGMKTQVVDIISKYRLKQKLLEGRNASEYNEKLSENNFTHFITGRDMKGILFDKSLYDQKSNVEELGTLYEMMGGDSTGISKDKLNLALSKALFMYSDPESYMKNEFDTERDVKMRYGGEAQEIINLLGTTEGKLTLEDFVNVMTTELMVEFDRIKIDN